MFNVKKEMENKSVYIYADCSIQFLKKGINNTSDILNYSGICFVDKSQECNINEIPVVQLEDIEKENSFVIIAQENVSNLKDTIEIIKKINKPYDHILNYCDAISVRILFTLGYPEYMDFFGNSISCKGIQRKGSVIVRRPKRTTCNNVVKLGTITSVEKFVISLYGSNALVDIGNSGFVEAKLDITTNGIVKIGDNNMFSHSILISQTDQHHIFDLTTHKRINSGKNVYIGNHIWVGRFAQILGGCVIADNCIIGANTVTSSKFREQCCVIAGNPGKVIRRNVLWTRDDQELDFATFDEASDKMGLVYLDDEHKSYFEEKSDIQNEPEKKPITINIWGSCMSRDIFRFGDAFDVGTYIGRCSFKSMLYPKYENGFEDKSDANHGWEKRMLDYDFKKESLNVLLNNKSDYLVIDLIDELFDLIKLRIKDQEYVVTYSQVMQRSSFRETFELKNEDIEMIRFPSFSTDELLSMIKQFADRIKEVYPVDRIIINEAYPSIYYIDKSGETRIFDKQRIIGAMENTKKLSFYYSVLEQELLGCHIIKKPSNIKADEQHSWGLATTHLENAFYEHAYDELCKITGISK